MQSKNSPKVSDVIRELKRLKASPRDLAGMARFGINTENAFGVSIPELRRIGKGIGKDHALAIDLWETGIHDARLLACFVDEPDEVTEAQMDAWVKDFGSWDLCDQCCSNLFDKTGYTEKKLLEWVAGEREFVRRAGFVLMACLAVHEKKACDEKFLAFLPLIKKASADERNYVRKAVNWALRQIGKRDLALNKAALEAAKEIQKLDSKAARWIASDAIRELESPAVLKRLIGKNGKNSPSRLK